MKNGFRVIDCDIHLFEPADLYERYLEPRFRSMAPANVPTQWKPLGTWFVKPPGQQERATQLLSHHNAQDLRLRRMFKVLWDNCARLYNL